MADEGEGASAPVAGDGGEVRPRSCYKCGKPGHIARDCSEGGAAPGGRPCFNCGKPGHFARECPDGPGPSRGGNPPASFGGGWGGNRHGQAPRFGAGFGGNRGYGGQGRRPVSCYRCGKNGHLAKDCSEQESSCYNCGKPGHIVRDCPEPRAERGAGVSQCYSCGGSGHFARDCPNPAPSTCYKCGQAGHFARDCTQ